MARRRHAHRLRVRETDEVEMGRAEADGTPSLRLRPSDTMFQIHARHLAMQGGAVHKREQVAALFGHHLWLAWLGSELQERLAGLELLDLDLPDSGHREPAEQQTCPRELTFHRSASSGN